jgi:UDP-glucose 4-epimerase
MEQLGGCRLKIENCRLKIEIAFGSLPSRNHNLKSEICNLQFLQSGKLTTCNENTSNRWSGIHRQRCRGRAVETWPRSRCIRQLVQGPSRRIGSVEIFGDDYPTPDGTCVRDYIHVVDLARAHILALQALSKGSAIYNLGCGGAGYSVRDVIETVRDVTGKGIPVQIGPRRAGDPPTLIASSDKIKRELGWQPMYQDLRVIVESAWRWVQSHPEGYEGR